MPKLKDKTDLTLVTRLGQYEQVIQAHTSCLTPDHLKVIHAVRDWCDWHERSFGEPLMCTDLAGAEDSRISTAGYRAHCLKYSTSESFRRKREHIRRFLRWGIQAGWAASDPFAIVLPTVKRGSLRSSKTPRPRK